MSHMLYMPMPDTTVRELASAHLGTGKRYQHTREPDKALLVPLPRATSRQEYQIDTLSETGYDLWRAYEFGALLANGMPLVGQLVLRYDMRSRMILESKSVKLYLHSFLHYTWHSSDKAEVRQALCTRIKTDMSAAIGTEVSVHYIPLEEVSVTLIDARRYALLDSLVHESVYAQPTNKPQTTIHTEPASQACYRVRSASLVSNCRVTNQPDWGDVFIAMESNFVPVATSLLAYIGQFRIQNHFHEECCELLFQSLWQSCAPRSLAVLCMYTRRGGIDINPVRTTGFDIEQELFTHETHPYLQRTQRQ